MNETVQWLISEGGPVIRYLAANAHGDISPHQLSALERELVRSAEVQKWLTLLQQSDHVHSSKDNAAENCIAKLQAYGATAEVGEVHSALEGVYQRLYENGPPNEYDRAILCAFLVSVKYPGYTDLL